MARNKSAPIGPKLSALLGMFGVMAIGPPLLPPDFNVEVLRAELVGPSHARCTFISLRKGGPPADFTPLFASTSAHNIECKGGRGGQANKIASANPC